MRPKTQNLLRNSNKIAVVGSAKPDWSYKPQGHRRTLTMKQQILVDIEKGEKQVTVRDIRTGKDGKVYGKADKVLVVKFGYANGRKCSNGSTPGMWREVG